MTLLIVCLFAAALSMVAAGAALFAAVWARSGAQKVDDVAGIVIPLLSRVKQKVDPDPMVASVVAAAAAAPPPAIIEPSAELPASSGPLPVIITEDDDERRESAPFVEPDEHSPTIPMAVPEAQAPPAAPAVAEAGGDRTRAEAEQDEADARGAGGGPPLVAGPPTVEPPETGPSRSGARARADGEERPAGYFAPYVVPPEPSAPDTLPPSSALPEAPGSSDALAERRRRAHELGQATERQRQLDARRKREAEEVARKVGLLSEEEAARPSGEGFAMDRPSWEGRTAVHDQVSLQAAMQSPLTLPVPIGHIVPGGAPPARVPPLPSAPAKPRAKADSSPTLTSEGIAPGPRQRFDPRVEPESPVDVTRPHPSGET
jgi:hypothetical protein